MFANLTLNHKTKYGILCLISFFSLFACSQTNEPSNNQNIQLTEAEKKVVSSSGNFGLKIFQEINQSEGEKNVFISPLSISMALGMTINGAKNDTYNQMQTVLNLENLTQTEINESYKKLINTLAEIDTKVIFNIANSIWYNQELTFKQNFIDVNKTYFDAQVSSLDFTNQNSVDIINNWVNLNTNGKIEEILDQIPRDAIMYLINAIYFKGTWTYEFKKDVTFEGSFNSPFGETICSYMVQTNDFSYLSNDLFQAIELPYGDKNFEMIIILPKVNTSVNELTTEMNEQNFNNWIGSFSMQKGTIYLPKFKLEDDITLNDVLIAMGMADAFDSGRADFTDLYAGYGKAYISRILHKTFIEVNEEGTEAAAATLVEISRLSSAGEDNGFFMKVNRPFVFLIREVNSNCILFMGKVISPK